MPKKKVSKVVKGATKKAKKAVKTAAPAKKAPKAAKSPKKAAGSAPVAAKGSVGFRLRMAPSTHKQLMKIAATKGVSQNTMINQLIQDAK